MMKHRIFSSSIMLLGTLSLGVLAGCGGGTTYGTGVSQESQLASDVGGLLLIGGDEKKAPIDYSSRPKLVKAPTTASLPTPAERVSGDAAYFPTDPEITRAKKLAALEGNEGNIGTESLLAEGERPKIEKIKSRKFGSGDEQTSIVEAIESGRAGKERRLARAKLERESRTIKRKYLTQPPVEYQIPADTAETGKVGEYEKSAEEKKKKGIFGW